MTSTRLRITHFLLALKLICTAAIVIGVGTQLPGLYAQATRVPSIFDTPTGSMPEGPASNSPTATRTPTMFATLEAAGSNVTPQATRIPSIFDTPTESTSQGQATSSPPATRVPSLFDTLEAPFADSDITPQATQIPSIFDSPAESSSGSDGATVPQATPYASVFDTAAEDVIRFKGEEPPDAAYCLACHANPYVQLVLPSNETISVAVNEIEYRESVHGQHGTEGYRCIRCHTGMNEYPHEEVTAKTARDLTIDFSTSCTRCHPNKYDETLDGVHLILLASGNQNAAVCADCHTGHAIGPLTHNITGDPLPDSSQVSIEMCTSCHAEIYEKYATSVHGSALLEGNPDVPTCADCHGVHNVAGPSTDSFRLFSPKTCATCHADTTLMAEYDVSTNVFETYVADFHGTTVTIFQDTVPNQDFNAPVCVDCHGVHDIMAVDSANSPVIKDNLVGTCQRCHPDAKSDFPDAWLSHYEPTFDRTPIVALADTIYSFLVPTVVGSLGMFVMTDVYRRRTNHRKDR